MPTIEGLPVTVGDIALDVAHLGFARDAINHSRLLGVPRTHAQARRITMAMSMGIEDGIVDNPDFEPVVFSTLDNLLPDNDPYDETLPSHQNRRLASYMAGNPTLEAHTHIPSDTPDTVSAKSLVIGEAVVSAGVERLGLAVRKRGSNTLSWRAGAVAAAAYYQADGRTEAGQAILPHGAEIRELARAHIDKVRPPSRWERGLEITPYTEVSMLDPTREYIFRGFRKARLPHEIFWRMLQRDFDRMAE